MNIDAFMTIPVERLNAAKRQPEWDWNSATRLREKEREERKTNTSAVGEEEVI